MVKNYRIDLQLPLNILLRYGDTYTKIRKRLFAGKDVETLFREARKFNRT